MSEMSLIVVTPESVVYAGTVSAVVAPGVEGEMGILPRHAPLITMLKPGELRIRKGDEETHLAVLGGFIEVLPHSVTVLADAAERAEDIDVARVEEARHRAEEILADRKACGVDKARAEVELVRSLARLNVARKKRKREPGVV
ncbi:MAG: F0F1 ATP synthase subunit epsilon [Dehalococcoidales bacterium]|nr:F0F1 ATP synthase subunit epsilon [Dehalococcoidales bacterium]